MEQNNIIDITPETLQPVVVDKSKENLVIVACWSPRDEGCMELTGRLENVAAHFPDGVILAKINVDEQPQIAMQLRIQSVPTVALFRDGQPVDSFVGMKDQAELEAFLKPHLPREEDSLLEQTRQSIAAGDYQSAFGPAKKAFELDNERADIKLVFADVCIQHGKLDDAEHLLQSIRMIDQDGYFQSLVSALQLARNAADSPEIQALQQQLEQSPDDNEIKVKLAVQLNQANRQEEALELLFAVLKKDMNFVDAKKTFLDILATMPDGDPVAPKYRRKIYSLMY